MKLGWLCFVGCLLFFLASASAGEKKKPTVTSVDQQTEQLGTAQKPVKVDALRKVTIQGNRASATKKTVPATRGVSNSRKVAPRQSAAVSNNNAAKKRGKTVTNKRKTRPAKKK